VQGCGQFDDAEARAEMPRPLTENRIDGFLTQLIGDLADLFHLEPAQNRRECGWCREAVFC